MEIIQNLKCNIRPYMISELQDEKIFLSMTSVYPYLFIWNLISDILCQFVVNFHENINSTRLITSMCVSDYVDDFILPHTGTCEDPKSSGGKSAKGRDRTEAEKAAMTEAKEEYLASVRNMH